MTCRYRAAGNEQLTVTAIRGAIFRFVPLLLSNHGNPYPHFDMYCEIDLDNIIKFRHTRKNIINIDFVQEKLREADNAAAAGDLPTAWKHHAEAWEHVKAARKAKSMIALGPPPDHLRNAF